MSQLRRYGGAVSLAGGVLLLVRVLLVLMGADGALVRVVTTAGVLGVCAAGGGLGWRLGSRGTPLVQAGAGAVGVVVTATLLLLVVGLVPELVGAAGAGSTAVAEAGTLVAAVVAAVAGGLSVGRAQRP